MESYKRYVLLLFNYSFPSPAINRCLYHYFNTLYTYTEEDDNITGDSAFDDTHQQEMQATYRPRLYCVLLLEIFNRIMHDPMAQKEGGMGREDIEKLSDLGKRIVTLFCFFYRSLRRSCRRLRITQFCSQRRYSRSRTRPARL